MALLFANCEKTSWDLSFCPSQNPKDFVSLRGGVSRRGNLPVQGLLCDWVSMDCTWSGAPRSESKISMIAGGNHTAIKCHGPDGPRNDSVVGTFSHKNKAINENLKSP